GHVSASIITDCGRYTESVPLFAQVISLSLLKAKPLPSSNSGLAVDNAAAAIAGELTLAVHTQVFAREVRRSNCKCPVWLWLKDELLPRPDAGLAVDNAAAAIAGELALAVHTQVFAREVRRSNCKCPVWLWLKDELLPRPDTGLAVDNAA